MGGRPCRAHGPDLKVRAGAHVLGLDPRNGRFPDELIDCKSTGWIDHSLKLRDYDATPAIRTYVLISQDEKRWGTRCESR
jgi:hypothetical protein